MASAIKNATFEVEVSVSLSPPLIVANDFGQRYHEVAVKSLRFSVGINGKLKSPWGYGNYVKNNGEEALTPATNVLVPLGKVPAAVQQDVRDEYRRLVTQAHENLY